ncbi:hypothetical protein DFQ13_11758 [Actinokineospora spheciospongiae]|nr:hypothetical protein DFQ13_11758 [Actinokineospora spheciospongiae]
MGLRWSDLPRATPTALGEPGDGADHVVVGAAGGTAHQVGEPRPGLLRRTRVEGRLGVVLHRELGHLRHVLTEHPRQDDQAEVQARGDPTPGDQVPVHHHPLTDVLRPQQPQHVPPRPVRRGPAPPQQPGGPQDQRAPADGGEVAGPPTTILQELQHLLVLGRRRLVAPTGHEQHVHLTRALGEHRRRVHPHPGVRGDRPEVLPHQQHVHDGGERGVRGNQVEQGQPRVEQHRHNRPPRVDGVGERRLTHRFLPWCGRLVETITKLSTPTHLRQRRKRHLPPEKRHRAVTFGDVRQFQVARRWASEVRQADRGDSG